MLDPHGMAQLRKELGVFMVYRKKTDPDIALSLPPLIQQTSNTMREWLNHAFTGHQDDSDIDDATVLELLRALAALMMGVVLPAALLILDRRKRA